MLWIGLVMLGLIVGSIVADLSLPEALKERLGVMICWGTGQASISILRWLPKRAGRMR